MTRDRLWVCLAGGMLVGGIAFAAKGPATCEDEDGRARAGSELDEVDSYLLRAQVIVDRALAYLQSQMNPDGSFRSSSVESKPTVAVAAMTALAYMAAGYTADDEMGRNFSTEIRRCIDWLMSQASQMEDFVDPDGVIRRKCYITDSEDNTSQMHGHGYATWALATAYGMTFGQASEHRRQRLLDIVQACVHGIERAQTESGGWGYRPDDSDHEGSVTVTQIQALRAARDAGLAVDPGVIERAIRYVRLSQVDSGRLDGGFRYQLKSDKVHFALTAAAVATLNQTGEYDSKSIDRGIEFMLRNDPILSPSEDLFPWYARMYATQAYFQYKTLRHFREYYPRLVEDLEHSQDRTGSFTDARYGNVYATASAALTLCIPFTYLPSFQR